MEEKKKRLFEKLGEKTVWSPYAKEIEDIIEDISKLNYKDFNISFEFDDMCDKKYEEPEPVLDVLLMFDDEIVFSFSKYFRLDEALTDVYYSIYKGKECLVRDRMQWKYFIENLFNLATFLEQNNK